MLLQHLKLKWKTIRNNSYVIYQKSSLHRELFFLFIAMSKEIIIKVNQFVVHFTYKHVKRINLRVKGPDGHIFISAPYHISTDGIKAIVLNNRLAISKIIDRVKNEVAETPSCDYLSGDTITYLGENYTLSVDFVNHKRLRHIEIDHRTHILKMETREAFSSEVRHQQLLSFYKVRLTEILNPLLEKWTQKLAVSIAKVRIKQMKSRWGSCSSLGNLSFNMALIKLPPELIELVVVHELTHRLEMNHGDHFYAIMHKCLPDTQALNKQLKSYTTEV